MKRALHLLLLAVTSTSISAQVLPGNRGFKMPTGGDRVVVYRLDGVDQHNALPRTLEDNLYFKIEKGVTKIIDGKEYNLIFIPAFTSNSGSKVTNDPDSATYVGRAYNRLRSYDGRTRWWIQNSDLQTALPYYGTWQHGVSFAVGAITLPVVARPERGDTPFSLDSEVNLGTSIGFRMRLHHTKDRHLSLLGIASLKQIKHTQSNNTGMTEEQPEIDGSGLALGSGLSIDWDGVQTGFFLGCDMASGALGKTYVYQDALWLGFGIGVNIFAPAKASVPKSDENTGN